MFGRFFQRFQQRVERGSAEHMNFVDYIDFITSYRRTVHYVFLYRAYLVHAVVARRVDFNNIHARIFRQLPANFTFVAGRTVFRRKAVDRFGKNFRAGSFTRSSRPREKVSVPHRVGLNLIRQSPYDMVLPDDFVKRFRSESSVNRRIFHRYKYNPNSLRLQRINSTHMAKIQNNDVLGGKYGYEQRKSKNRQRKSDSSVGLPLRFLRRNNAM